MLRQAPLIILIASVSCLAFIIVAYPTYSVRAQIPNDGPPYAIFLASLVLFGAVVSVYRLPIALIASVVYYIIWAAICLYSMTAMMANVDAVVVNNTMLVLGALYIISGLPIVLLATYVSVVMRKRVGIRGGVEKVVPDEGEDSPNSAS